MMGLWAARFLSLEGTDEAHSTDWGGREILVMCRMGLKTLFAFSGLKPNEYSASK
jgi:hypothetical protein